MAVKRKRESFAYRAMRGRESADSQRRNALGRLIQVLARANVRAVRCLPASPRVGWLHRAALVVCIGVALGGPRSASARGHERRCIYSPEIAEALRHAYPDSDLDDDGVLSREEACDYQAALRKRFSSTESELETALTAKRWVYATYFNRLKRQVAMNWEPQSVWRKADPTGARYGFKTRVTEVRVSLSPKGDLAKIVVTSSSGIPELDGEAVRAFRAAAPFPNPPDGLIKDNLITFAFSFHFEIGAPRTSWRVLRP